MAGYGIKKMGWTRTMTAYESMTAWRAKRKEFQKKYEANLALATNALATAANDQGYAIGEIAAKRALKRISDEAKVRQEKMAALLADDNEISAPKQSVFARHSSTTLDGGSKIDLSSDTLTLSNGTKIDLKTGMKKIDVKV